MIEHMIGDQIDELVRLEWGYRLIYRDRVGTFSRVRLWMKEFLDGQEMLWGHDYALKLATKATEMVKERLETYKGPSSKKPLRKGKKKTRGGTKP